MTPRDAATVERVLEVVAAAHGFTVEALVGPRRYRGLVAARQQAMWLARSVSGASLPEVARAIGGRDHTTVMHGVRVHDDRMRANTATRERTNALADRIRAEESP